MDTPSAIALISEVEVKKVTVLLSLSGVEKNTPILECLWPRVTFTCNGVERTFPFTYWRQFRDAGIRVMAQDAQVIGRKPNWYTMTEIAFLAASLRPCERPIILRDAAEAKGKMLYKKIYKKIVVAARKQSFVDRHKTLMRRFERIDGKNQLRALLLKLPHRLEKRDVIEAWKEAVVIRVMDS
jgi:hypothetical protein